MRVITLVIINRKDRHNGTEQIHTTHDGRQTARRLKRGGRKSSAIKTILFIEPHKISCRKQKLNHTEITSVKTKTTP